MWRETLVECLPWPQGEVVRPGCGLKSGAFIKTRAVRCRSICVEEPINISLELVQLSFENVSWKPGWLPRTADSDSTCSSLSKFASMCAGQEPVQSKVDRVVTARRLRNVYTVYTAFITPCFFCFFKVYFNKSEPNILKIDLP